MLLPTAPSSGFSSGSKTPSQASFATSSLLDASENLILTLVPAVDGGQGVVYASFLRPEDAIAEFRERKITFMLPQMYLFFTLADILWEHGRTVRERGTIVEGQLWSHGDVSFDGFFFFG